MTKTGVGPFRSVRFRSQATGTAVIMPTKYMAANTSAGSGTKPKYLMSGTKVSHMMAYTGMRAEQLIRGAIIIVAMRSRGLAIVRVDITPGTAQAKELMRGMKLWPLNPQNRSRRSIKNAARAM